MMTRPVWVLWDLRTIVRIRTSTFHLTVLIQTGRRPGSERELPGDGVDGVAIIGSLATSTQSTVVIVLHDVSGWKKHDQRWVCDGEPQP